MINFLKENSIFILATLLLTGSLVLASDARNNPTLDQSSSSQAVAPLTTVTQTSTTTDSNVPAAATEVRSVIKEPSKTPVSSPRPSIRIRSSEDDD